MLFVCVWDDEQSFMVDAPSEAAAAAAGLEEVGRKPRAVRQLPPHTFGARVVLTDDPEDPDGELLELEPLEHVIDMLGAIEDEFAPADEANVIPLVKCKSEAEDEGGRLLLCELAADHADDHRKGKHRWPNTSASRKVTGSRG